jgi:hypothetical protein
MERWRFCWTFRLAQSKPIFTVAGRPLRHFCRRRTEQTSRDLRIVVRSPLRYPVELLCDNPLPWGFVRPNGGSPRSRGPRFAIQASGQSLSYQKHGFSVVLAVAAGCLFGTGTPQIRTSAAVSTFDAARKLDTRCCTLMSP